MKPAGGQLVLICEVIMRKTALFVYNGDPMCFIHVLLNALDMHEKGGEVKIIIEGSSVNLLPSLASKDNPLNNLWEKVKNKGLIEGVCRACAGKPGQLKSVEEQELKIVGGASRHPGMEGYRQAGFEIITF